MKKEKENEELDVDERAITLTVDDEVIRKVCSGEIRHISLDINDHNYREILENIDGNLILVVDVMPETFHGCYLYNNGEFPYAIKSTLEFLVFKGDNDFCLARIIDVDTAAGTRFRFKGPGDPSVEDPDGDSCIWEVGFEVIPVPKEPRRYLMRWNPTISSFTEKDFEECLENREHGMFRLNWSISEWQEARRGDIFYMLRTGDDKAGIAFSGQFICDPYPGDDWAGSNKRRMYVDMICINTMESEGEPIISIEKLQKAIPDFDWTKGHSGVLLSDEIAEQLNELWE